MNVLPASAEHVEDTCQVLAAAFRDNPLNVAVIGRDADRRLHCNLAGMRQLVPVARRHGLLLRAGGASTQGALIATPPDAYPLPAPSLAAQLRALFAQGLRVRMRWGQVFEALYREHPLDPHWYLATVGVAPSAQGRGVGRALVAALLERADRDGRPCYLESDRPENVPFYEAAGFRVEREIRVLGVRVWLMRRPEAGAAGAGRPGR